MTTIALNFKEMKKHPQRVSNSKPFINNYNCEGTNSLSKIEVSKRLEKSNPTIALNNIY